MAQLGQGKRQKRGGKALLCAKVWESRLEGKKGGKQEVWAVGQEHTGPWSKPGPGETPRQNWAQRSRAACFGLQ